MPASRSTRRCRDVFGWLSPVSRTSSPTGRGPSRRRSRIMRRPGSAITSNVVVTPVSQSQAYISVKLSICFGGEGLGEQPLELAAGELEGLGVAPSAADHDRAL